MRSRCEGLGADWGSVSAAHVYTVHDIVARGDLSPAGMAAKIAYVLQTMPAGKRHVLGPFTAASDHEGGWPRHSGRSTGRHRVAKGVKARLGRGIVQRTDVAAGY